jgi:hypothetical protein
MPYSVITVAFGVVPTEFETNKVVSQSGRDDQKRIIYYEREKAGLAVKSVRQQGTQEDQGERKTECADENTSGIGTPSRKAT